MKPFAIACVRSLLVLIATPLFSPACETPSAVNVALEDSSVVFGVRDASSETSFVLDPIASPAPPEFHPPATCPPGWNRVAAGPTFYCEPWMGQVPTCADGEMAVPGQASCVRVGSSCPAGDYPDAVVGPTVFVRAGALHGDEDGTREHPHVDLVRALAEAPAGARVLLAPGVYTGEFWIDRNVSLEGVCSSGVVIESSRPRADVDSHHNAIIELREGAVRSVTVRGVSSLPMEQRRTAIRATGIAATVEQVNIYLTRYGISRTAPGSSVIRDALVVGGEVGIASIDGSLDALRVDSRDQIACGNFAGTSRSTIADFVCQNATQGALSFIEQAMSTAERIVAARGRMLDLLVTNSAHVALQSALFDRGVLSVSTANDGSLVARDMTVRDHLFSAVHGGHYSHLELHRTAIVTTGWRNPDEEEIRQVGDFQNFPVGADGFATSEFASGTIAELVVLDVPGGGLTVFGKSEVVADDVWVERAEGQVTRDGQVRTGSVADVTGSLNMERLVARDVFDGVRVLGGESEFRDVRIERCSGTALSVSHLAGPATLDIQRGIVDVSKLGAFVATHDPQTVAESAILRASDLVVSKPDESMLVWGKGAVLEWTRGEAAAYLTQALTVGTGGAATLRSVHMTPRAPWDRERGTRFSGALWLYQGSLHLDRVRASAGWAAVTVSGLLPTSSMSVAQSELVDSPIGIWIPADEFETLRASLEGFAFPRTLTPVSVGSSLPVPTRPELPDLLSP